jgi:diketogulonate reductase-like aldo/keto reductase
MAPLWIDGVPVPRLWYGTAWKENATADWWRALTAGFRAIDTANQRKHHEAGVGAAPGPRSLAA